MERLEGDGTLMIELKVKILLPRGIGIHCGYFSFYRYFSHVPMAIGNTATCFSADVNYGLSIGIGSFVRGTEHLSTTTFK
ncbi:hypothetical protein [Gelidibacter sp.]|uniref:hypothetical protein n=1 Tax=Gelidibacter sp. TaxID=2018083 RepID=UPI002BD6BE09|nr:hypothetical protein [Gelidibacter sp.]HUH26968.1 hypothetical protein [Gelidibacter sp.]